MSVINTEPCYTCLKHEKLKGLLLSCCGLKIHVFANFNHEYQTENLLLQVYFRTPVGTSQKGLCGTTVNLIIYSSNKLGNSNFILIITPRLY